MFNLIYVKESLGILNKAKTLPKRLNLVLEFQYVFLVPYVKKNKTVKILNSVLQKCIELKLFTKNK